jgi:hypothetical protein
MVDDSQKPRTDDKPHFVALSAASPLPPDILAVKTHILEPIEERRSEEAEAEDECPFMEVARLSKDCEMTVGLPAALGECKDPRDIHPVFRSYRDWEEYKRLEKEQQSL